MAKQPDDFSIADHVEAIHSRSYFEGERMADHLVDRSWPGGPSDRSGGAALAWLSRWRPRGPAPLTPVCSCAAGRCVVCN